MLLLGIRFIAELVGVAAAAYLGASVPAPMPWPAVLGLASPIALVFVWTRVAAPKARILTVRRRGLVGTGILAVLGIALALDGQPVWGTLLAAVVLADQALILASDADGRLADLHASAIARGN